MTTPAPSTPPISAESAPARPLDTSLLDELWPKLNAAAAGSDVLASLDTAVLDLGLQRDPAGRHSIRDAEALGRPLFQIANTVLA